MTKFFGSIISLSAAMVAAMACTTTPPDISDEEWARLDNPSTEMTAHIDRLMPEAMAYLDALETRALAEGRALTPGELEDARAMGVEHPERIRILAVGRIPEPTGDLAPKRGLLTTSQVGGMTSGYGITVLDRYAQSRWLLTHEFVHVDQLETEGREAVARRSLLEQFTLPNNLIPLEREAISRSETYLGETGPGYAF